MISLTRYDIPAVIFTLLSGLTVLLASGFVIHTVVIGFIRSSSLYNTGFGMALPFLAIAIFLGSVATALGVWFVKENEFKIPATVLSALVAAGLFRSIIIITTEPPRSADSPAILFIVVSTVGMLLWYVLNRFDNTGI